MVAIGIRPGNTINRQRPKGRNFYVDPVTGNDSNTGLAPSSAWATPQKVSDYIYNTGLKRYDRILFRGGQTHSGNLYLGNEKTSNTHSNYRFESFGGTKATIQDNISGKSCFYIYNIACSLKNLVLKKTSLQTSNENAVTYYFDSSVEISKFSLINCDIDSVVTGFSISAASTFSGTISNLLIQGCSFQNCVKDGINFYKNIVFNGSNTSNLARNIVVRYCTAQNIAKTAPFSFSASGQAVVLGGVFQGLIEKFNADGLGSTSAIQNNLIWVYNAKDSIIQDCTGTNTTGSSTNDRGAFGIDINCYNCTIQRCFAYNCDGEGILIMNGSGNAALNNIIINCAKVLTLTAGIIIYGGNSQEATNNVKVLNNTVVQKNGRACIKNFLGINNGLIANNIFISTASTLLVDSPNVAASLSFLNNQYYSSTGTATFKWGGTTYTGLTNWRGTPAQEKIGTTNYGFEANPMLSNLAGTTPSDFKLTTASATDTKTAVLNIFALYGANTGLTDYFGVDISRKIPSLGADSSLSTGGARAVKTFDLTTVTLDSTSTTWDAV